jgi:hypothetical protein
MEHHNSVPSGIKEDCPRAYSGQIKLFALILISNVLSNQKDTGRTALISGSGRTLRSAMPGPAT